MNKTVVFGVFCLSILFSFAMLRAQDDATAEPERIKLEIDDLERPVMISITPGKKVEPRLPNGYRNVLEASQKEEVYKIQKEYNEIIERLRARIRHLEIERNRKIDGLLTTDQAGRIRRTTGALESERHLNRSERALQQRRNRRAAAQIPATTAEKPAETPATEN